MPPQANALLLTVDAQSSTDDWFDGTPGAGEFDGGLPVYYDEKIDRRTQEGGSNVVVWRTLTVDERYPLVLAVGKVLTWRTMDGQTVTGTVQAVERSQLPGIPARHRTVDLVMELA